MSRPPELLFVQETPVAGDVTCMEVFTDQGVIVCLRHGLDAGESDAVMCLSGALGGLSGPAGSVFHHVTSTLGGVRIHYRKPNDITHCVLDALLVHHLLDQRGVERHQLDADVFHRDLADEQIVAHHRQEGIGIGRDRRRQKGRRSIVIGSQLIRAKFIRAERKLVSHTTRRMRRR